MFYFYQSVLSLSKKGKNHKRKDFRKVEKCQNWASVLWLHSTTVQLILGQLQAGYLLLGTVVVTNRCRRWSCRCCWMTRAGCYCWLWLLIAAVDCFCWLLLLIAAVDCCCWLLLLVAGRLVVVAGILLAGWLLLAAGILLAGWLLVAAVGCCGWLLL